MDRGAPVWITRARPGAEATAARVEALGFSAVVDPLLDVRFLSPELDLSGVAALAFTSANGVTAFARLSAVRDLPVFAVGDATAQAAEAVGFSAPASADGDAEALAELIAAARPGLVLHPGARQLAADLPAMLAARGVAARGLAAYATEARAPSIMTPERRADLAAVLIHSPRAARTLAAILAEAPAPDLRALCLSEAVAGPLSAAVTRGELGSVAFAPRPRESALLDLLAR